MAHFAELDGENNVIRVVVVDNEHEEDGVNWCEEFFGGGVWVQTSYNGNLRKNYAGIGCSYDSGRDAFIPPKPHASWKLEETKCRWKAPIDKPEGDHLWDETNQRWNKTTKERDRTAPAA